MTAGAQGAERFVPAGSPPAATWRLRRAAAGSRGCELWSTATQTVFGEGPAAAKRMLVGEQPGDREDVSGHPFVGPAGRVLDSGLELAGIPRDTVAADLRAAAALCEDGAPRRGPVAERDRRSARCVRYLAWPAWFAS